MLDVIDEKDCIVLVVPLKRERERGVAFKEIIVNMNYCIVLYYTISTYVNNSYYTILSLKIKIHIFKIRTEEKELFFQNYLYTDVRKYSTGDILYCGFTILHIHTYINIEIKYLCSIYIGI